MNNRLFLILFLVLLSGLFSCRTYKPLISTSVPEQSVKDYVTSYKDLAVTEMNRTGIPASITLAQGIIESDCGHSSLAREANNHFGIKCHDNWTGQTVTHNDNRKNECFRKYRRPEESFYDHSDFLKMGSRYTQLFNIDPMDYKGWARGLKRAGYATNPNYAEMLIKSIEENNLWYFDRGDETNGSTISATPATPSTKVTAITVTNGTEKDSLKGTGDNNIDSPGMLKNNNTVVFARTPRVMENNRIQYIIVKDGDTREKIEKEFQLLKWELPRYNELDDDFSLYPGQILYLQPKRKKAEPGKDFHKTAEGESMYLISQRYGIQLKSLVEMNRTTIGVEPQPGTKIWLRSIKPVN
jgi:LysM repeat protein